MGRVAAWGACRAHASGTVVDHMGQGGGPLGAFKRGGRKEERRGRKRGGDGCINDMSAVWVGVVVGVWTYLRRSARRARSLSLSVIGGESC